ncbi:DUF1549 domain-containing protein [Anatilimnocola sp. NA78]|uniref:DUF1549 domain-containing protein n=1 Tax=Anatilimnocola sp. NA78 TaxID=3415683 RepID=UPI003CE5B029
MPLPRPLIAFAFAALCGCSLPMLVADDLPLEPLQIGSPTKLEVQPAAVKLSGKNATAQLVVTGHYADGTVQDLTRAVTIASSNGHLVAVEGSVLRGKGDGNAEVTISAGGQQAKVPVEVIHAATPARLSFEFDALVALSKNGCNSGACHGSPSGKGGFRLSLRAFDPVLDNLTLIREDLGRRTNKVTADESLLLLKPLMKVPHGGGQKLKKSDPAYAVLRDWIEQGCQADPADQARCVKIEVSPPTGRQFKFPAHTQQLAVRAHFSDGTSRDVTPLACYSSSDTEVAEVTEAGLVIGKTRGEAAILVRYLEHIESCFLTFVKEIPGYQWPNPPTNNYIDELVHTKLRQLQYLPSGLCSDEEFLRRAYCDVIGTPPTVEEVRAFLSDGAPDKRAKAINSLLDRPEYARFWALKWGDLLRLTNQQIGNSGMFKYHRWVERALATNMPYDQFAKELIVASGSTLQNPAANFYRTAADTNECVETISQVFLGARLQCAKCHNHPFERWTQDNYYGMAAFFNRVQRKKSARTDELVVYMARAGEVTQPRTNKQMKPWLPQRGEVDPPADGDRRDTFANWLVEKENPYFAKIEVNRIWSHLLGRGIVEPADDFRESNPPSNAPLLDALAKDFVQHGYDRKHVLRTILNSRTYQADFRPNDMNKDDVKYFSHYQPRLLSAEQLLDSICAVTDLPEAFAGLPAGTKATQLPSPDLAKHEFLKIFGQPERQTVCACERTSDSNLGMAIQFFNGPLIYGKLRDANNRFRKAIAAGKKNEDIIEDLYLAAVSRRPTPKELEASLAHIAAKGDQVVGLEDICWALLNTNEFLFQH